MNQILNKIIKEIKDYVKSINTPENEVFKNNELLIYSCFNKSIEIQAAVLKPKPNPESPAP